MRRSINSPINGGSANAAGSNPIIGFGHTALTSRYTNVKCAGPASADTAQGTMRSSNSFRKINGKIVNTAVNARYQISGTMAASTLNRCSCHAYSSATLHTRPIAVSHSAPVHRATPNNSTTNSIANPNTGDGFANGIRKTTMINSRNGRMAESAGICASTLSDRNGRDGNSGRSTPFPAGLSASRRAANTPTAKNTSANPPITISRSGTPVTTAGSLNSQTIVAPSVNTNAPIMASTDEVTSASANTTTSSARMHNQTSQPGSGSFITGIMTSNNATNGNRWPHHTGMAPGRRRWRTMGKAVCRMANSK